MRFLFDLGTQWGLWAPTDKWHPENSQNLLCISQQTAQGLHRYGHFAVLLYTFLQADKSSEELSPKYLLAIPELTSMKELLLSPSIFHMQLLLTSAYWI